jgi:hypothetical protein
VSDAWLNFLYDFASKLNVAQDKRPHDDKQDDQADQEKQMYKVDIGNERRCNQRYDIVPKVLHRVPRLSEVAGRKESYKSIPKKYQRLSMPLLTSRLFRFRNVSVDATATSHRRRVWNRLD